MPEPSLGSIFVAADRQQILTRLEALRPEAQRQWGKMSAAQMLAHCSIALELPMDDATRRQRLFGKLLAPFVRDKYLGDAPLPKGSPTDPKMVIGTPCDFTAEMSRLRAAVTRFVERGPQRAGESVHSFFGALTGEQWGRLVYKHLDHHLRQFDL
ncbi:MAG: DUF1569 domain-containing protein [Thermoanaerobaculia bacterium]